MRSLLLVLALAGVASAQPAREVERLAQTARNLARDGQCEAVASVAQRVQALDRDYYDHVFLLDPAFAVCLAAQPSRDELPEPKSEGVAVGLSLGITAGGGLLLVAGAHASSIQGPALTVGLLALAIGPTTGHIYAGHTWSTALGVRIASVGTGLLGAMMVLSCIDRCQGSAATSADVGAGVFLASAFVYGGATLVEIATAQGTAREYNASHAAVTIAPLRTRDGTLPALAITGRF